MIMPGTNCYFYVDKVKVDREDIQLLFEYNNEWCQVVATIKRDDEEEWEYDVHFSDGTEVRVYEHELEPIEE